MLTRSAFLFSVVRRMTSSRNVAVVLAAHGAPMVSIDLSVAVPGKKADPQSDDPPPIARVVEKNMLRPRDDSALKTLERLRLLLGPPDMLKSKGAAGRHSKDELLSFCPTAELLDDKGEPMVLTKDITNDVAWRTAKAIRLAAGSPYPLTLPIRYNLPTVTAVSPPNVVYVGVPCVPTNVTTMFAENAELKYEWEIAPAFAAAAASTTSESSNNNNNNTKQQHQPHHHHHHSHHQRLSAAASAAVAAASSSTADEGVVLCRDSVMIPPPSALGKRLRLRVRVNSDASMWTEVESPIVLPTPKGFEPMPRWSLLKPKAKPEHIRTVSYNILHDGFATSKRSRARLYAFATDDVLNLNYRRARIVQEMFKYDADVMALQEVGRSVFDGYLDPIFRSRGYAGKLRMKNNLSREGVAILVKTERFDVERFVDFTLNYSELEPLIASVPELRKVAENPQFKDAMENVPSVGLICVARDKLQNNRPVIIGNTHLYYHALGCHVRILQTFILTKKMEEVARELNTATKQQQGGGDDDDATTTATGATCTSSPAFILCGDFNMTRPTGGYCFMTTGKVACDHASWDKSQKYYWGMSDNSTPDAEGEEVEEDAASGGEADVAGAGVAASISGGAAGAVDDELAAATAALKAAAAEEEEGGSGEKKMADGAADTKQDTTGSPSSSPVSTNSTKSFSKEHVGLSLELGLGPMRDVFAEDPTLTCTNYSLWFKEIIDHIFVSPNCSPVQLLPSPSQEELAEHIAIPSHMYPSDHTALVCDLEVK